MIDQNVNTTSQPKHMKTPHWFTRIRFLSHLRVASAVTLISLAATTAFVAVTPSGLLSWAKSSNKNASSKFSRSRVELFRNKLAIPGPQQEGGPTVAADKDYSNRAAGRAYVPFQLTSNAQQAWKRIKSQRNRNTVGTWTLAGPSKADDPNVLTFSGAEYVTSGRITALAIDPSCNNTRCRVWAAAAGGGVWQTDNALSGNGASWTFVSSSFATNAIGTLTYDATHNTLYAGTGEPNASGDSEAGFGIYKSTDGGNSWTHLAANTSVPQGAGVDCTCVVGSGGFQQAPAYTGPAFDGRDRKSVV